MVGVEFGLEGWRNELDAGLFVWIAIFLTAVKTLCASLSSSCNTCSFARMEPACSAIDAALLNWCSGEFFLASLKRAQAMCDEHGGLQWEKVMNWRRRHVLLGGFGGPVRHGRRRKGGEDVRKDGDVRFPWAVLGMI
ncbi:hypothetical protein B0H19DRAFT_1057986 [Mycena capillaripes]|nr:hypothetical protein B0H19DRAFT_1057986 [Mycena capillaripes]